jgi:hypothetical protein
MKKGQIFVRKPLGFLAGEPNRERGTIDSPRKLLYNDR